MKKRLTLLLKPHAKRTYKHLHWLKNIIRSKLVQVQKCIRQNFHTAKLPYGELILRQNFPRRKFLTAKFPNGEFPTAKFPTAKLPTAKFPKSVFECLFPGSRCFAR